MEDDKADKVEVEEVEEDKHLRNGYWKRTSILGMVITENASAEINQCPVTRKNLPQPEACPSVNVWRAMLNRTAVDMYYQYGGQLRTGTKI